VPLFSAHTPWETRKNGATWTSLIVVNTELLFVDRFRAFGALYEDYPHAMEILGCAPEEFVQIMATQNPSIEQVLKDAGDHSTSKMRYCIALTGFHEVRSASAHWPEVWSSESCEFAKSLFGIRGESDGSACRGREGF
jgi:hypothetical protein